MSYNASRITQSLVSLKAMNAWCTVSLYSQFSFRFCWMQNKTWSIVDMLRRNPNRRSPIISPIYGLHFERRIPHKCCMKLIAVITHDNYYSLVILSINLYNKRLGPLSREVFLILNRINEFMDLTPCCFTSRLNQFCGNQQHCTLQTLSRITTCIIYFWRCARDKSLI
jgi:hypothetical protein